MLKTALIIFVRKPERGKVKTRLAADIGDDLAMLVYERLLAHTHSITCNLPFDKFVFYAGSVVPNDCWRMGYAKRRQSAGDLGQRMRQAFHELFSDGYERVCIIGSDCLALDIGIIEEAMERLTLNDAVVGPATDGGYYLLGTRAYMPELFENIAWSTAGVLAQTLQRLEEGNCSFALLPALSDIDTVNDLPVEWRKVFGLPLQ